MANNNIMVTRPGKRLQKNYGKIHQFVMGKLTISTGQFSIANCNKLPEGTGFFWIFPIFPMFFLMFQLGESALRSYPILWTLKIAVCSARTEIFRR